MKIEHADCQLLHVMPARPRASAEEQRQGRLAHTITLLVQLRTDTGLTGIGFAYTLQGTGRGLHFTAVDDIVPLLVGEDPLDHERLEAKVYWRLQGIGRRGLVPQAYSAFDMALWDLKGKAANLPLFKLLGGARESVPAYASDSAWLYMKPAEIVRASQSYLDQGLMGIKVKVGADPGSDAERLHSLREAWGDDIWLAVDANQRYDYATALALGHFFEDDIGVDWFEEPILCEDVAGHARLAERLETPIAAGESLDHRDEFERYLEKNALGILQPDITRLGGITSFLRVAALADQHHKPMAPHLMPEVMVQLACALPRITCVEWMPWFVELFQNPPRFVGGRLVPGAGPGLGLDLNPDAVAKFRVIPGALSS
jgi:L-alanine-DL-glutamate epimerase-like enolase superfamily enzyme